MVLSPLLATAASSRLSSALASSVASSVTSASATSPVSSSWPLLVEAEAAPSTSMIWSTMATSTAARHSGPA